MATINYTAEQINHRLDLINENKNLLPYPYKNSFPAGFENVGDGSVLTTLPGTYIEAQLADYEDCSLPAGTYTVSIEVTDLIGNVIDNPGFQLVITGANVVDGQFTLENETAIQVKLVSPANGFGTGLLVKPQIEVGTEKTAWVPYMKTIGNYVDERFNSTNTKIRDVLAFMKLIDIIDVE